MRVMQRSTIRRLLKFVMVVGFALMPIGPCARASNEGFGDPPGPIEVSNRWQRISYVLVPLGGLIVIGGAIGLMIVDRRR